MARHALTRRPFNDRDWAPDLAYNSLYNTCTTNVLRHVRRISPRRFPLSVKVLLPAYSDRLAYDLGLIDSDLDFQAARDRLLITERALRHHDGPDFSRRIRD